MSEQNQADTPATKAAPKAAAKKATPKPAKKATPNKPAKKTEPAKPAKKAEQPPIDPNAAPNPHFEDPEVGKVAIKLADPDAGRKAAEDEVKKAAAARRADHVAGLETELAFLERQPKPNKDRISQVKEQIDTYSKAPKNAPLETA